MPAKIANPILTSVETPAIERIRCRTYRGQASWAQGPQECRHCVFWDDLGRKKSTQARACRKFKQLMGAIGPRVPASALACPFFSKGQQS
jgi:hypothetical protein